MRFDFEKELKEIAALNKKNKPIQGMTKKESPKGPSRRPKIIMSFIVFLALLLFFIANKKDESPPEVPIVSPTNLKDTEDSYNRQSKEGVPKEEVPIEPIIKSIRLSPSNPTSTDNIVAEVEVNEKIMTSRISFKYQWVLNNETIIEESEDSKLDAGKVKKGNYVSVRVIPYKEGIKQTVMESNAILVHNSPPTLELNIPRQRVGPVIEFQLIAFDPDGDKLTFALEEPRLEGMQIDHESGKITFRPPKNEKGSYRFRASVTDSDRAKATGSFELNIDISETKN